MTDPDYRGRGLSCWLIDRVLEDFEQQVDFVFLYANDSVLDFYPKFGFKRAPEFFAVAEQTDKDRITANKANIHKLNVTQQQDQQILMRIASQTTAQYRMTPRRINRCSFVQRLFRVILSGKQPVLFPRNGCCCHCFCQGGYSGCL